MKHEYDLNFLKLSQFCLVFDRMLLGLKYKQMTQTFTPFSQENYTEIGYIKRLLERLSTHCELISKAVADDSRPFFPVRKAFCVSRSVFFFSFIVFFYFFLFSQY